MEFSVESGEALPPRLPNYLPITLQTAGLLEVFTCSSKFSLPRLVSEGLK